MILPHSLSSVYQGYTILTPACSTKFVSTGFSVIPILSTSPDPHSRVNPISVIAGVVAGTLAVLVIFIAVAIVCLTVIISVNKRRRRKAIEDAAKDRDGGLANPAYTATTLGLAVQTDNRFTNPTYAPSAIGQAVKANDRFTNPAYSPTVSGHAVQTDDRFINPMATHSPTAVGYISPELQQHSTPSDPRRVADEGPQYAVLGDPTSIAAASTTNKLREYEDIDNFTSSPNYNKPVSPSHNSEVPQPASNVDLPPTTEYSHRDSLTIEHTYSHLDHKVPGGNEVPNPSYSHLLHGLGGGDSELQRETSATTQHIYSHLVHDVGGHMTTQTGARESAYSHISDYHT